MIVTITQGTCIFLKPFKSSASDVEITIEDNNIIEINDFKRTVKKMVMPLSVTVMLRKLMLNFNNILPLLVKGINIEMKKGNKKRRNVLFTKNKKLALKIMDIKIPKIK